MLYDINIEAWNKIVTFLQRDVNIIYICVYFDIIYYIFVNTAGAPFDGRDSNTRLK